MSAWFERFDDALWIARADRAAEAAFLAKALGVRRGTRVLDAPCGEGAVTIHLARRGAVVTGVDLREPAVARARAAFAAEGLAATFVVADLRDLAHGVAGDASHDAAVNWYGSFGYFATQAEDLAVLRGLARAVRRGGRVVVEQPCREFLLRHFRTRMVADGVTVTSAWDARAQRVESVRRKPGARTSRSSIRLYTPSQLRELFDAAGLDVVAEHGHWDGCPASRGAPRTIVVGRRR